MAAKSIQPTSPTSLVIGLGLTGFSVIRHLMKTGGSVAVADTRELPPYLKATTDQYPDLEIVVGRIPYERFVEFDQIVVSPGIEVNPDNLPDSCHLIGDIELFAQCADAPVIAVTGSNGKSTVTMLVNELLLAAGLRVKTGGNIGTPALDLLDQDTPDFYVLELSSFQLETTQSLRPASATLLNISEDHMDRYQSLDDYIDAKKRIFNGTHNIVVNRDDSLVGSCNVGDPADASVVSFGLGAPNLEIDFGVSQMDNRRCLVMGNQVLGYADELTLQGDQNISNVLAALALVKSAGVDLNDVMINAGMNYGGLPHRCEIVAEVNGVKWINDSKGTNVGATIAAIKGFKNNIILICGGKSKGADFTPLAQAIDEHVSHTLIFGEDAPIISASLSANASNTRVSSLNEAITQAKIHAQPGGVVLFSPACASFDMFDNFEHRGNVFKELVLELVY